MIMDLRLLAWSGLRGERLGGDFAEGGHAQADRLVTAGGGDFYLGELVAGGGEADFESFGLARPAFAFGFADPGDQVVADAGQPSLLGWVHPQEGAPDAGVLVDAAGAVGPAAVAE